MTAEFILDEWLMQWEPCRGGLDLFAALKASKTRAKHSSKFTEEWNARLLYLHTEDQLL